MDLEQALRTKWYGQGFNSTPLILGSATHSNFLMKKTTGFAYANFLYDYKNDYGNMHYMVDDLELIGKSIVENSSKDPDYFYRIRKKWEEDIKILSIKNLEKKTNAQLKSCFDMAKINMGIVVGAAHIIEPYSLTMDIKIKEELSKFIDLKNLNNVFSTLMSPIKKSFVNEYEESLKQLSNSKDIDGSIKKVIKNFYWIRNSYAGKQPLTREIILQEMRQVEKTPPVEYEEIKNKKDEIIKRYKIHGGFVSKIRTVEFLTHWQDERKERILKAIDILDSVIEEIGKRFKIRHQDLRYMASHEDISSLEDESYIKRLHLRRRGCILIYDEKHPKVYEGQAFSDFISKFETIQATEIKEITGLTASALTAIGNVQICKDIESISNFKAGNVLVTSMTRPEYLPAMKKACAIVTDEGGITCHAAIVSRELGIPCIIGTKVATKVLKDGDLVEVKGNHGLIIILKRS